MICTFYSVRCLFVLFCQSQGQATMIMMRMILMMTMMMMMRMMVKCQDGEDTSLGQAAAKRGGAEMVSLTLVDVLINV